MPKLDDAVQLLAALGVSCDRRGTQGAVLLALCGLKPNDAWTKASGEGRTIRKGIMDFIREHYGIAYAENTRESVRKNFVKPLVSGGLAIRNADNPGRGTNSPNTTYSLTPELVGLVRAFGSARWDRHLEWFIRQHPTLQGRSAERISATRMSVMGPRGETINLPPGAHHELEAAVLRDFVGNPLFFTDPSVLYISDAETRSANTDTAGLSALRIQISQHDALPDLIAVDTAQERVFFIEAFHSGGAVTPDRVTEFRTILANCPYTPVFVTAFSTMETFRRNLRLIAWETEVWVAEEPDHLIHLDGERFLPRR